MTIHSTLASGSQLPPVSGIPPYLDRLPIPPNFPDSRGFTVYLITNPLSGFQWCRSPKSAGQYFVWECTVACTLVKYWTLVETLVSSPHRDANPWPVDRGLRLRPLGHGRIAEVNDKELLLMKIKEMWRLKKKVNFENNKICKIIESNEGMPKIEKGKTHLWCSKLKKKWSKRDDCKMTAPPIRSFGINNVRRDRLERIRPTWWLRP